MILHHTCNDIKKGRW